jgi:hypothetical protein
VVRNSRGGTRALGIRPARADDKHKAHYLGNDAKKTENMPSIYVFSKKNERKHS